ncbi:MAG TPA: DNA primase catalytic subunit PriS [Methanocorpusculum sp.]|nr:DNA primase catalytic subunit PriS [Methanocorpusculum sp.]
MKPATLEYLKKRFASYYNGELKGAGAVYAPSSMSQREWGFLYFSEVPKPSMRRHLAFNTEEDLQTYLKSMTPAHVYYSSAYYAQPAAPLMADKEWLGADLIFDLDADHILHAAYDVMLSRVKEELFKLIDMLTGELGFARKDLRVNFSGGRGYHIHIPLLSVRNWGPNERREVVNYVSGTGISAESMFTAGDTNKWKLRFTAAADAEFADIAAKSPEEAVSTLCGISGFTEKNALPFCTNIPHLRDMLEQNPSSLKDNTLVKNLLSVENNPSFHEKLLSYAAQTDEPVTTDVKRLIRYPGSLHGGSGMRVVPVDIDDLQEFDPLVDAVVFGEKNTQVTCRFPLKMTMLENTYSLEQGVNTVPEALAVFLCCRGIAEYGAVEL